MPGAKQAVVLFLGNYFLPVATGAARHGSRVMEVRARRELPSAVDQAGAVRGYARFSRNYFHALNP
jgi:hypothetical protein